MVFLKDIKPAARKSTLLNRLFIHDPKLLLLYTI